MILHHPFFIGSALAPAIKVGDATLSLLNVGWSDDHRHRCSFELVTPDFTHIDHEMCSGVGGSSTVDKFENYLGFMSACAESLAYKSYSGEPGENADLFPPHVGEWILDNKDEIDMTMCDLQDENGRVLEHLIEE